MYFLDSCICIDFMRGKAPRVYALLKNSDPAHIKIPAIVEAELRTGAEKSRDPERMNKLVDQFLRPFEVIPFDSSCAQHYSIIRTHFEKQGMTIGANGLLIAATALAHEATLVTANLREFQRVPNLKVEDWEEVELPD